MIYLKHGFRKRKASLAGLRVCDRTTNIPKKGLQSHYRGFLSLVNITFLEIKTKK